MKDLSDWEDPLWGNFEERTRAFAKRRAEKPAERQELIDFITLGLPEARGPIMSDDTEPNPSLHTIASEAAHALGLLPGDDMGPIVDAVDRAYECGLTEGTSLTEDEIACLRQASKDVAPAYRHYTEVLTTEVLDSIYKQAMEQGDMVTAMRCDLAKTDDFALRDVAICLDEQWAEPMDDITRDGLAEGIKWLVIALRAAGFHTCDSGDGSAHKAGMECALPFRHVALQCAYWQDPKAELERVRRYLAWIGADDEFEAEIPQVEDEEDPGQYVTPIILVLDKRASEIMEEAGFKGLEPREQIGGAP